MSNTTTLRIAVEKDIDDLVAIKNEALKYKLLKGDTAWETEPYTANELMPQVRKGYTRILMVGDQPTGTVDLLWEDQRVWGDKGLDRQAGYIHGLAVRDAFRGQPLGDKIIDLCGSEALKVNCETLRLDCPASNKKLCTYYEQLGFTCIGLSDQDSALYERPLR